ncbi:MAG TPA: hypothetical protein VHQ68_06230 [Propionibacteriaceae bacterium]|nr:hypothetical protein [Propionibacteriaceae bacterium]
MTTRLYDPTTTSPVVRGVLVVTMAVIVVGLLALVRATRGAKTHHVTVRVDNQTRLAVQIDALDHARTRVGLGEAEPRSLRTFHEVQDIGAHWTFVAAYGGREVYRETLARTELAEGNWTITIPAGASDALEQAGFQ